jgi:hypothetical protein
MNTTERTVDSILEWFEDATSERRVVSPSEWVDAGLFLTALMGEEYAKLAHLEQSVAREQLSLMEQGKTAAYAKVAVKAMDVHRDFMLQKLKCDRVLEFVRLAKNEHRWQVMK